MKDFVSARSQAPRSLLTVLLACFTRSVCASLLPACSLGRSHIRGQKHACKDRQILTDKTTTDLLICSRSVLISSINICFGPPDVIDER